MKRLGVILIAAWVTACAPSAPKEAPRTADDPARAQPSAPAPIDEKRAATASPSEEKAPPATQPVDVKAAGTQQATPAADGYREVFPHVRFDAKGKAVQFDGVVPIDAHDVNSPWVFLEVAVCTPDSKEHEALVVTEAKASHVHAALLLAGLNPGKPGRWTFEEGALKPVAPEGDPLRVTFSYVAADGSTKEVKPQEMIFHAQSGRRFGELKGGKWLFTGSQIVTRAGKEWYDADGAGTLIGLTTFGSETIAWSEVISHEAAVEEPVWIADKKTTPPVGTKVTVTIQRGD